MRYGGRLDQTLDNQEHESKMSLMKKYSFFKLYNFSLPLVHRYLSYYEQMYTTLISLKHVAKSTKSYKGAFFTVLD